jgi:hypothetical protein
MPTRGAQEGRRWSLANLLLGREVAAGVMSSLEDESNPKGTKERRSGLACAIEVDLEVRGELNRLRDLGSARHCTNVIIDLKSQATDLEFPQYFAEGSPSNSAFVQGQWKVPSRALGRVSSTIARNSRTQSVNTSQRHCTHVSLCRSSNRRANCHVLSRRQELLDDIA